MLAGTLLATGFAAYFTGKQWNTAFDTERRQLRAYVNISKIGALIDPNTGLASIQVVYENFGQTPATQVKDYAWIAIRQRNLKFNAVDTPPNDLKASYLKNLISAKSVIAPSDTATKNGAAWCDRASTEQQIFSTNTPLSAKEREELKAGTSLLYLYGEISYRDAFGHDRVTRYQTFTNDGIARGSDHVVFSTEGNCIDDDCLK